MGTYCAFLVLDLIYFVSERLIFSVSGINQAYITGVFYNVS